ncbi:MAG: sensor histidine kinase [Thiothrix sp.]|nr:MAG: sensor histidine kinase [Thiothrix sp.]
MLSNKGSLRTRLVLLFGLVLLIGGAFMLLAANALAQRSADQLYDKLLESAALTAVDSVSVIDQELQFDLPYAALATLALSENDRVLYSLTNHAGKVITGYQFVEPHDRKEMLEQHQQGLPYFFNHSYQNELFRFVILERRLLESGMQDKVYLQMGQSRLARDQLAADLTFKAMIGLGGLIILGWLFVWLTSGWSLRPLLKIEQELACKEPTDLTALSTQVPAETAQLVDAINKFMGRLQRNQDRNHAFIAEAAHQLRTPLASLQAQAELATEDHDIQTIQKRTERILRNARETNTRINQLLNYATLAHRADIRLPERFILSEVVNQVLVDLAPIALTQAMELSFDNHIADTTIKADPEAIKEILRNLVDNALKYGKPNTGQGLIHVSLNYTAEPNCLLLQVQDFGAGVPADLLEQITQRFGRGELTHHAGSGLGLAIVEQLVHGMQGRFSLVNVAGGGLTAQVFLQVSV